MNCDFTEKISQLIDDELSEAEAQGVRQHLASCESCQRAHEDFLSLGSAVKAYAAAPDLIAERRALRQIVASDHRPFWRRNVALPVPAFVLLLIAFVSLGLWTTFRRMPTSTNIQKNPEKVLTAPAPLPQGSQGAFDLARFDHGERASIYKVRRANQGDIEQ
jgi:predicted anti-sigma-YlaC factor YlaD